MRNENGYAARIARRGGVEAACRVRDGGTGKDEGAVYVAVYGTLMRGERNERWRAGVETVTEGTMDGVLFDTGWGFPNFVPLLALTGPVRCEVLRTDAAGVARMDVLEGYPNLYDRVRVAVKGDDGRTYDALVYTMVAERRSPQETRIRPRGGAPADWREWRRASGRTRQEGK